MITPKKILLPLFLIIVLITFSILLKIVIAGYTPPFGGEYTNLCGGLEATHYDADCIPGQCVAYCSYRCRNMFCSFLTMDVRFCL
jgi:hypothetical protein